MSKTKHRIVALFDPSVILLDLVIFIAATPMLYLLSQNFGNRSRIGAMSIRGHLFGTASGDGLGTAEEALGRGPVALRAEHRINQSPFLVDRTIQIAPLTTHF